jgi:hypothetical protein
MGDYAELGTGPFEELRQRVLGLGDLSWLDGSDESVLPSNHNTQEPDTQEEGEYDVVSETRTDEENVLASDKRQQHGHAPPGQLQLYYGTHYSALKSQDENDQDYASFLSDDLITSSASTEVCSASL